MHVGLLRCIFLCGPFWRNCGQDLIHLLLLLSCFLFVELVSEIIGFSLRTKLWYSKLFPDLAVVSASNRNHSLRELSCTDELPSSLGGRLRLSLFNCIGLLGVFATSG